jgi:hypothetical protein
MVIDVGDRVKVRHGTFTEGFDLSGMIGVVKNTDSYIQVYFSSLQKTFNMLRYEIDPYRQATIEDLQELMYE